MHASDRDTISTELSMAEMKPDHDCLALDFRLRLIGVLQEHESGEAAQSAL